MGGAIEPREAVGRFVRPLRPSPSGKTSSATEYRALRDETLERMRIQHQLISTALIAPGAVLGIGLKLNDAFLILLYPFFGMLLCAAWAHQDFRKRRIGLYILQTMEQSGTSESARFGWETALTNDRDYPRFLYFSARGIFLGTEGLALIAGLAVSRALDWVPQTLAALIRGQPSPLDFRQITVQRTLLVIIDHLWLVLLIGMAVASIIMTAVILHEVVVMLRRVRNLHPAPKISGKRRRGKKTQSNDNGELTSSACEGDTASVAVTVAAVTADSVRVPAFDPPLSLGDDQDPSP